LSALLFLFLLFVARMSVGDQGCLWDCHVRSLAEMCKEAQDQRNAAKAQVQQLTKELEALKGGASAPSPSNGHSAAKDTAANTTPDGLRHAFHIFCSIYLDTDAVFPHFLWISLFGFGCHRASAYRKGCGVL
jgi:hypothetical protein